MHDHDQLIDETGAALETNRRNIRMARELALHEGRDHTLYDQALKSIEHSLDALRSIIEQRIMIFRFKVKTPQ